MTGLRGTCSIEALSSSRLSFLLFLTVAVAAGSLSSGSSGLRCSLSEPLPSLRRGLEAAGGPGLASWGLTVLLHFSQSTWRGRKRMVLRMRRPGSRLRDKRRRVRLMVLGGGCGTHC